MYRWLFLLVVVSLGGAAILLLPRDDDPGNRATAQGQHRVVLPQLSREGFPNAFPYTIVAGDTLFSIAQRFDTTVDAIVALNQIADPGQIRAGAVIFIPETPPPTPTPTPPSGPSVRIDHGSRSDMRVALTFDMGGRVDPALDIMQWLIDNEVKATIFMTGSMAANPNTNAGRQVIQLVEANPQLFQLGNHSYSHPDFRDLSAAGMVDELRRTETAIANVTDVSPRPLFRPPFGGVNQAVLNAVGPAGYPYTIMWDVDTIDWLPVADGGPTAQQMVTKVVNNAQGGTIVLMHLGGYNTLQALPAMVAGLEARGFTFATVGELIAAR